MPNKQQELYEIALSKMAIPTCECLLDDSTATKSIKNKKALLKNEWVTLRDH